MTTAPPVTVNARKREERIAYAAFVDRLVAEVPHVKELARTWDEVRTTIRLALENHYHVLLHGPPGTGKTTLGAQAAKEAVGKEAYLFTTHADQSVSEGVGMYLPDEKGFVWQDGPFLTAWDGAPLVINEVDQAAGPMWTALHALLDDHEMARFTLPTGRVVRPAPGFVCVATMNSVPSMLAPALQDRFSVVIPVMQPSVEALATLRVPRNKYASADEADTISLSRTRIVAAVYQDAFPNPTFRQLRAFWRLRDVGVGLKQAAKYTLGGTAEELVQTLKLHEEILAGEAEHQAWKADKDAAADGAE